MKILHGQGEHHRQADHRERQQQHQQPQGKRRVTFYDLDELGAALGPCCKGVENDSNPETFMHRNDTGQRNCQERNRDDVCQHRRQHQPLVFQGFDDLPDRQVQAEAEHGRDQET